MHADAVIDVAIVGGGLVGASLALSLVPTGRSVALIEAHAPASAQARWDERCIAINDSGMAILSRLGVWSALSAQAHPIRSTHISEQGRFGVTRFDAAEAGIPALGYNTPLRAIGDVLWQALRASGVSVHCPARVTALEHVHGHVVLALDGGAGALRSRLVVAADGAESVVRRLLGVGAQRRSYAQQAIVTAVRVSRAHGDVAYERFTPEGPLALLPKGERACSLVWSLSQERAQALLGLGDAAFVEAAQAAFGQRVGRFGELGARAAYPLEQVVAEHAHVPRAVFIGNASQSLHPVAAQGFNLGLRDAAGLARALEGAADPGAAMLLEAFAESRRQDRDAASEFTDLLVRVFSNRVPGLAQARHWGLLALDLATPLKRRVRDQHLGYRGLAGGGATGPGGT